MSTELINPAFKYLQHFCIGVDVLTEVFLWRRRMVLIKNFSFTHGTLTFCEQISEGIRVEFIPRGPYEIIYMNSMDGQNWTISRQNIHTEYDNTFVACKAFEENIKKF